MEHRIIKSRVQDLKVPSTKASKKEIGMDGIADKRIFQLLSANIAKLLLANMAYPNRKRLCWESNIAKKGNNLDNVF